METPPQVEDLTNIKAQLESMTVERDRLLDAWGVSKDIASKITSLLDQMKLEFAKLAVQRDAWRRIASDYRTMAKTETPLTSQGASDAVDPRPVDSPP